MLKINAAEINRIFAFSLAKLTNVFGRFISTAVLLFKASAAAAAVVAITFLVLYAV